MVDELRSALEHLEEQPPEVQRHIAELVEQELAEMERPLSSEIQLDIEQSRREIAAGDYVTLDDFLAQQRRPA